MWGGLLSCAELDSQESPAWLISSMVAAIIKEASPNDRVAIWTINVNAKDLGKGFQEPKHAGAGRDALAKEYGMGATDLDARFGPALRQNVKDQTTGELAKIYRERTSAGMTGRQ